MYAPVARWVAVGRARHLPDANKLFHQRQGLAMQRRSYDRIYCVLNNRNILLDLQFHHDNGLLKLFPIISWKVSWGYLEILENLI